MMENQQEEYKVTPRSSPLEDEKKTNKGFEENNTLLKLPYSPSQQELSTETLNNNYINTSGCLFQQSAPTMQSFTNNIPFFGPDYTSLSSNMNNENVKDLQKELFNLNQKLLQEQMSIISKFCNNSNNCNNNNNISTHEIPLVSDNTHLSKSSAATISSSYISSEKSENEIKNDGASIQGNFLSPQYEDFEVLAPDENLDTKINDNVSISNSNRSKNIDKISSSSSSSCTTTTNNESIILVQEVEEKVDNMDIELTDVHDSINNNVNTDKTANTTIQEVVENKISEPQRQAMEFLVGYSKSYTRTNSKRKQNLTPRQVDTGPSESKRVKIIPIEDNLDIIQEPEAEKCTTQQTNLDTIVNNFYHPKKNSKYIPRSVTEGTTMGKEINETYLPQIKVPEDYSNIAVEINFNLVKEQLTEEDEDTKESSTSSNNDEPININNGNKSKSETKQPKKNKKNKNEKNNNKSSGSSNIESKQQKTTIKNTSSVTNFSKYIKDVEKTSVDGIVHVFLDEKHKTENRFKSLGKNIEISYLSEEDMKEKVQEIPKCHSFIDSQREIPLLEVKLKDNGKKISTALKNKENFDVSFVDDITDKPRPTAILLLLPHVYRGRIGCCILTRTLGTSVTGAGSGSKDKCPSSDDSISVFGKSSVFERLTVDFLAVLSPLTPHGPKFSIRALLNSLLPQNTFIRRTSPSPLIFSEKIKTQIIKLYVQHLIAISSHPLIHREVNFQSHLMDRHLCDHGTIDKKFLYCTSCRVSSNDVESYRIHWFSEAHFNMPMHFSLGFRTTTEVAMSKKLENIREEKQKEKQNKKEEKQKLKHQQQKEKQNKKDDKQKIKQQQEQDNLKAVKPTCKFDVENYFVPIIQENSGLKYTCNVCTTKLGKWLSLLKHIKEFHSNTFNTNYEGFSFCKQVNCGRRFIGVSDVRNHDFKDHYGITPINIK